MNIDEIAREYQRNLSKFQELKEEATYAIQRQLKERNIEVHSVVSRVKSIDSFLDKLKRVHLSDPVAQMQDVVGIRVICLYWSQLSEVSALIREHFKVIKEDNKIEKAELDVFGYMSIHFIVKLTAKFSGPRYDSIRSRMFEIQVRTVLMDAWANVSHHLQYKSTVEVPAQLRRDFHALSGLFYVADQHFEMFYKATLESREKATQEIRDQEPELEINWDTLNAYLNDRFPDRGSIGNDTSIVEDVIAAGINTVDELESEIKLGEQFIDEHERSYGEDVRMAPSGIVRFILDLTKPGWRNEEFFPADYLAELARLRKKVRRGSN